MENSFKILQLMFMRLVIVYLQTITVTLLGLNNIDRSLIKDLEDETLLFKLDISRMSEVLDESP